MEPGKVLKGRYRIVKKIGSGGMADVYLGYDTVLERNVAVKLMHPHYASDENFVRRFKREAQAAANLNHPNIVSVFDWGAEDSTYFIVMELIKGKTLKEIIKERGALPVKQAIDIAKQIASALAFAHKHEVVHRDIKPQNIIITDDGLVKVTDFGIARAKSSAVTDTGTVMGSVHYISPEQAQGLPATELSDIYSLGVVMYEMLTGNLPYTGDTAVAIAMKHATEQPPRPSSLNPEISPELEKIILKAMAKDPFDRYQSAEEILADLRNLESGRPVSASDLSYEKTVVIKPSQFRAPKRRGGALAVLATLFILLIAVGAIAGVWYYQANQSAKFTEVPKLIDLTLEQAKSLAEKNGLNIEVEREEYSEIYAAGKIISQDPPPGVEVEKGTTITVVVSKGERPVEVPELIGKSEIEAGRILGELGLRIGEITYDYSEDFPEGVILSQEPTAGVKVKKGTAIDIVISKGIPLVLVPEVVSLTKEKAIELIEEAGLTAEVVEEESTTVEAGRVIRQSPSPGDTIKKGEKVIIVVSTGPATVTIPDVVGQDSLTARQTLEELGLVVEIQNVEVINEEDVGKVVQQSPEAGQKVLKNSTVTLFVGI